MIRLQRSRTAPMLRRYAAGSMRGSGARGIGVVGLCLGVVVVGENGEKVGLSMGDRITELLVLASEECESV